MADALWNFFLEGVWTALKSLRSSFLSLESRYSIYYLFLAILLVSWINIRRGNGYQDTVRKISQDLELRSPSHRVDFYMSLLFLGGVFTVKIQGQDVSTYLFNWVHGWDRVRGAEFVSLHFYIIWAAVGILLRDFVGYISHRCMHEVAWLWKFHRVHHSAEKIGFYTVLRMHPLDVLFMTTLSGLGFYAYVSLSYFFWPEVLFASWLNLFLIIETLFAITAFLRHSSTFLNYPMFISHILLSPAMHLRHHDKYAVDKSKNFGRIFSLWDLLFKTIDTRPLSDSSGISYGVLDKGNLNIESFWSLLLKPFLREK